jgi:hypothetical protein
MFERASKGAVVLAVIVFLANMLVAWWLTYASGQVVGRSLLHEEGSAAARVLDASPKASANTHVLLNRILDAELQLRTVQNRQTITIVAMSVAFALLAIGFALFVMGAEGAFKVEGQVADRGNLVVKATAPGLLCFLVAAFVVAMALAGRTDMATGNFRLFRDSGAAANSGSGAVEGGLVLPDGPRLPDEPPAKAVLPAPALAPDRTPDPKVVPDPGVKKGGEPK